jgi:hypothetical protein
MSRNAIVDHFGEVADREKYHQPKRQEGYDTHRRRHHKLRLRRNIEPHAIALETDDSLFLKTKAQRRVRLHTSIWSHQRPRPRRCSGGGFRLAFEASLPWASAERRLPLQ